MLHSKERSHLGVLLISCCSAPPLPPPAARLLEGAASGFGGAGAASRGRLAAGAESATTSSAAAGAGGSAGGFMGGTCKLVAQGSLAWRRHVAEAYMNPAQSTYLIQALHADPQVAAVVSRTRL